MTTTGIRGHLSFSLSNAAAAADGTITTPSPSEHSPDGDGWWTQPFTAATLAVNEFAEMLPQELGATLFTRGGYKSGSFLAGSASMEVRLHKYFGKILQAIAAQGVPTAKAAQATVSPVTTVTIAASLTDKTLVFSADPIVVQAGDVILTGAEKLLVLKELTATTYAVVRGYDGTTPAIHSAAAWDFVPQDRFTMFAPEPGNEQKVPFVHARRYVPDSAGAGGYTEYGFDGKAVTLSLAMPQMGAAKAEFGVVLRRPYGYDGEDLGGLGSASLIPGMTDTPLSLALSCTSSLALPSMGIKGAADAAFMGAQVQLVNGTISPQDGMIVGSYHPEDFTVLSRGGTIRMAYKWKDEALYNAVVYGGDMGNWSPTIKYSDVVISMVAASNATNYPYRLDLVFPNVALTMSAPTLVGGRFVMTEVTGAVTYDSFTGYPWIAFLRNGATYAGE